MASIPTGISQRPFTTRSLRNSRRGRAMQPELPIAETAPPPLDISSWPRVTRILEATGVADYSKIPNAEFYLSRGKDVHMICEDIDKGMPDYWTGGELAGYADAW